MFCVVLCAGPSAAGAVASQPAEYDDLCEYEEIDATNEPSTRHAVTIATTSGTAEQQPLEQVSYLFYLLSYRLVLSVL